MHHATGRTCVQKRRPVSRLPLTNVHPGGPSIVIIPTVGHDTRRRSAQHPSTSASPGGSMKPMDGTGGNDDIRIAVAPGSGRIARRDRTLLFVPATAVREQPRRVDELFERFALIGASAAAHTEVPRCVVDWSDASGHVVFDSSVGLWVQETDTDDRSTMMLDEWIAHGRTSPHRDRSDAMLVVASDRSTDRKSVV